MRIRNLFQVTCVLGLTTAALHAQATPEDQARALKAVRAKVAEMEHGQPGMSLEGQLLPQAQQMLRDGRLSQSEYDKVESKLRAYQAKPNPRDLDKIRSQLSKASSRPVRSSPAAEIDARERISLHQQQRAMEMNDPNAAYARDLERRVRQEMQSNPNAFSGTGVVSTSPGIAPQPVAPPARTAVAPASAPAPVRTPAPTPSPAAAPAPTSGASSAADAAYARDLERRVQEELRKNPNAFSGTASPAPAVTKPAPQPAPKPAPSTATAAPVKPSATPPATRPAPAPGAGASKPAPKAKSEPSTAAKPASKPGSAPAPAPAPAPRTKREKLAELLERYKADKVTPAQYQEERARILAEP